MRYILRTKEVGPSPDFHASTSLTRVLSIMFRRGWAAGLFGATAGESLNFQTGIFSNMLREEF